MAGRITATPRDVTGWRRSREAGRCLSTEFTGYEGMEGTKGTRKTESLTFLVDNIKIITINHIGVFFHLFWWVGEGCTRMCVPMHVETRGQPQVVCSLSTIYLSIEMGH